MKSPISLMILGTALAAAPAAFAQTQPQTQAPAEGAQHSEHMQQSTPAQTAPQPGQPATQSATPAAPGTTGAAAAPITDAEVTQFASAALAVEKIRNDATVPEASKNDRYVAAIRDSGLTAVRFNHIATSMQTDQELNSRIQKAGAELQQAQAPADAAAPTPAASPTSGQ